MTINVTGAVLASVLFEHSNSICDKEGLLLGKLSNITTDTISDSSLNNVEHQTVYYMHSFLPCEKLFSWYNNRGEVQTEALQKILNSCNAQDVIGWYKLRRHSSLSPSVREQAVHKHLEGWMSRQRHPDHHLVFFLCVSQSTFNGALYTTDHQFMMHDGRRFQNMPVTIMNLGNISKPHYQTASNFTCSTDSSYSSVVKSLRSSFVNGIDELASVKNVEKLKSSLHDRLKNLCERLTKSEADLAKETADVRHLRRQVQAIEGSMASAVSRQTKVETHKKKGLLQSSRQNQDEEQMETVTGKELEEERQLITFDDDDGDDGLLDNSFQPAADNMKGNEKTLLHGMTTNHTNLVDQNSEALNAIQIDDDSDTEEKPTMSRQQKHGIKDNKQENPFDFLVDILDTHPVVTSSSYALRSQSALPSDQKGPAGRITRRTRASKPDTMDWETTSKESQEPDGIPAQKSKRNAQKVYGREDD